MVFREQTRRRLRAGGLTFFALGLLSLGFGVAAPYLAPDRVPVPVALGSPTRLFGTGPFDGTLALYGALPSTGQVDPAALGCTVENESGRAVEGALTQVGLATLDHRVIDDVALAPLTLIKDPSGGLRITCAGTAARQSAPLYLIATTGQRDLVPMAAYSFATCGIVLGLALVVSLRPLEVG